MNRVAVDIIFLFCILFASSLAADEPRLPTPLYDYSSRLAQIDTSRLSPGQRDAISRITDEIATLGRVLFYDRSLSANDSIACGSCHQQHRAFSDGLRFSTGYQGGVTGRNAMAAFNTLFHSNGFFWDLRAPTLEEQVLIPIQDSVEMGMNLDVLVSKLSAIDYYPPLFEAAFGSDEVSAERIASALAAFLRTIISNRSRFDEGIPIGFSNFTEEEEHGRQLFSTFAVPGSGSRGANCFLCHSTTALLSAGGSAPKLPDFAASIGLDEFTVDSGYGSTTGQEGDMGTFKVPSVRNTELTGPYMHDGRLETLEDVIDHYDLHVLEHPNLHDIIRTGGNIRPGRLDLTAEERAALVAFLKTFTDHELLEDELYSDPFEEPSGVDTVPGARGGFMLHQNYPNPFNPSTTVEFAGLPAGQAGQAGQAGNAEWVTLQIFDITGRHVKTLVDRQMPAGSHSVRWDGTSAAGEQVASGIYLYRMTAGEFVETRRMLLMR